jgi:hypothetical protein
MDQVQAEATRRQQKIEQREMFLESLKMERDTLLSKVLLACVYMSMALTTLLMASKQAIEAAALEEAQAETSKVHRRNCCCCLLLMPLPEG